MSEIEITIKHKNSQQTECIICLNEFIDNNYIEFPDENSSCKCVYKIHNDCLDKCKSKCPICLTNIKSNEEQDISNEDISVEDKIICGIKKKKWYIIGIVFGFVLFASPLIYLYVNLSLI